MLLISNERGSLDAIYVRGNYDIKSSMRSLGDYTRSATDEIKEKDNKLIDELIEGEKIKYYKPKGKQRGE